ncbi:MAG: TraR/DksA family transcriptional regulator [Planctomycetota bacterium]
MAKLKKKSAAKATNPKAVKKLVKRSAKKLTVAKPSKSSKAVNQNRSAKTGQTAKAGKVVVKNTPPKSLSAEMLRLRTSLMQILGELRNDIDHEVRGASERDLPHTNDTFDMASDSADGDLSLRLAESETAEAGEIKRAIEKINNGTYGLCETCNKPISAERLQFRSFATLCIKCQELSEIRKRVKEEDLDDLIEDADDIKEDAEDMEDD